jgi:hypothetical protein
MVDKILILDGSERLHVRTTLKSLDSIGEVRNVPQHRDLNHVSGFVNSLAQKAYNPYIRQIDVNSFVQQLDRNRELEKYSDFLKIIVLDHYLCSENQGVSNAMGVSIPDNYGNQYLLVSAPILGDEEHAQHVITHELGHAFGAPSKYRRDVYELLGLHCVKNNCTMHQEIRIADSIAQAKLVKQAGRPFCYSCANDIRRYRRN